MNNQEFDYIQAFNLVDHRPFVVPGLINWMRAQCGRVHLKFIANFPGVEGVPPGLIQEEQLPVAVKQDDKMMETPGTFKVIVFNFSSEACSNFFTNEYGIGCMMRISGKATSVFVPYASMLAIYTPDPVDGAKILGCDSFLGRVLVNYVTPGMIQALMGQVPEQQPEAPPPAPEPKPRPNHLKRVQ